ncbi:MAG TPA: alpha-1,4-glucan--maltose-1-phosphate maltosyltransferase [Solirubrobacteraceae bacterium]
MPLPNTATPPARILIEDPRPLIDCGRYPAKACVGDRVSVSALVFRDGAAALAGVVRYRGPQDSDWSEAPLRRVSPERGQDRWEGSFVVDEQGSWRWEIEAWTDAETTWREELERKIAAGQDDLSSELAEGALLLRHAAARASGEDQRRLATAAAVLEEPGPNVGERTACALDRELAAICTRNPDRSAAARMTPGAEVEVERLRARFGSWYELFPRSFGGFAGVAAQLPRLAELGFDVVYLPPIHPIGRTRRKGANNALIAGPSDPGSPWAIGAEEGGHTAVHPDLGTLADFDALIAASREAGIEIALDFAIQCSADHPWLSEHPEWFHHRPDGTLKYAENPPKRYEDIYNVNFDSENWRELWLALRGVVEFWVDHGVRIFRVDNPHTKPFAFWQWLIAEVRAREPDVLFLSEAFTRPVVMRALAKLGFSQSYTYFTWKNTRAELEEYVQELAHSGMELFLRPNFFANTPDILHEYLQLGGPAAFRARLVLAATLSPSYGIYSGFENFENVPVHAGSEEYLDSEKYELKQRSLDGPLLALVARLNEIRREHAAFQRLDNIVFLPVENDQLLAYAKLGGAQALLVVVNLDPARVQEGVVIVPSRLGLPPAFEVHDLLSGERFSWRLGRNFVRLDPGERSAHLLLAEPSH